MMSDTDIFNLDKTDDIPENFAKELRLVGIREEAKLLLGLFDKKNKLTIDEILVGLYRLYGMQKTRVWVSSTLYNLSRKKLVKKVEGTKGEYEKC